MSAEVEVALLPCPFCGASSVTTHGPYGRYREWYISHSCKSFKSGTSEAFKGFPSEAAAISAWNARATTPKDEAIAELVARMRDAREWLQGWASAEPYISKIDALIAKHSQVKP